LVSSESKDLPDLRSKDRSFWVEVKAGGIKNCGVIKQKQLFRYDKKLYQKRFYSFCFHPLKGNLRDQYPSPKALKKALYLHSLYLFPFSIVQAHFHNSTINSYPGDDFVVKMRLNHAQNIFNKHPEEWHRLSLNPAEYKFVQPFEKINIITREGNLENEILSALKRRKK
jgi:hypothetical protein